MLHAKRRFELPLPFAEWLARAADERVTVQCIGRVQVWRAPMTANVIVQ